MGELNAQLHKKSNAPHTLTLLCALNTDVNVKIDLQVLSSKYLVMFLIFLHLFALLIPLISETVRLSIAKTLSELVSCNSGSGGIK